MASSVVHITDKNFRVTIPEDIRVIENLKQGDFIQIDIQKIDIPENEYKSKNEKSVRASISELNEKLEELPDKIANAILKTKKV
ncbi:MAG: hypothetical protein PHZ02_01405 [Desulfocapsaceae bacterium]|nr:hypothetical protein [Desulfocapsaceae bacterium]